MMDYSVRRGVLIRSFVDTIFPSGFIGSVGYFPRVESSMMILDELKEWFYRE